MKLKIKIDNWNQKLELKINPFIQYMLNDFKNSSVIRFLLVALERINK